MEKILTNRLQWFLTHKNILSNNQSGFRQSRSANDNLVFFDHTIKTAFSQNSNAYALFLDISKAYDTTSTQGLLVKLSKIGLTGNLLGWIKNFLTNRSFRVRIGNVTSHKFLLTTGVPQGSVISPILFNIMMHDFPMKQDQGQTLLFADDISFITTEYTSDRALITLQSFLNSVAEWCETWKFKMSPDKCALMVFTKKKITDYPLVQLDGVNIPTVTSFKFLGVTFDSKLNWKQHIDTIYNKCSRLLPLFYRLTRPTAAPSIKALLIIYKSLVRSIIDYGLIVYSTAAKTNIVKLDRIQNSFLRIILGSLPSTPIAQLQFETGIESIELRALWLSITYVIKLGSNSSNCNYTQLSKIVNNDFTFSTRSSPCLLQAILSIKKCNFSILENIPNASVPPPWQTNSVNILHLRITKQAATLYPEEAKALFLEFLSKLPKNAIHIFCDGSLFTRNNRTAAAYIIPRFKKNNSWSLQPGSSVLSAELSAIDGALTEVYHIANVDDEIYIFSDSLSSIQLLENNPHTHSISVNIMRTISNLKSSGIRVTFVWVPSHVGIEQNEAVDILAKNENINQSKFVENALTINEKRNIAKHYYNSLKQSSITNKVIIHSNLPFIGPKNWFSHDKNRIATIALHRLRSGHNHLNAHRSKYKPVSSLCRRGCNNKENTFHILLECPFIEQYRIKIKKFFSDNALNFNQENILGYNKELDSKLQIKIRNMLTSFLSTSAVLRDI